MSEMPPNSDERVIERLLAKYFEAAELGALYERLALNAPEQEAMKELLASWRSAAGGLREQIFQIQLMEAKVDDVAKVVWAASVVADELAKRSGGDQRR